MFSVCQIYAVIVFLLGQHHFQIMDIEIIGFSPGEGCLNPNKHFSCFRAGKGAAGCVLKEDSDQKLGEVCIFLILLLDVLCFQNLTTKNWHLWPLSFFLNWSLRALLCFFCFFDINFRWHPLIQWFILRYLTIVPQTVIQTLTRRVLLI